PEDADEIRDVLRDEFRRMNQALRKAHLPSHTEPEVLPPLDDRTTILSFPYDCLHRLRRVYAHVVGSGVLPQPLANDEQASEDKEVDRVGSPRHHLLWHSDCEGYYLPVEFNTVLETDDVPGGAIGSSQRLMAELLTIGPHLGIALQSGELSNAEVARIDALTDGEHPYQIELMVWLALFEAARLSLTHRTAISFG